MSKLLVETYNHHNLQLLSESQQLPPGCLGILKGTCADYKDPTRNGRFYSEKLWKKVFEDDRIVEALQTKTLFGELDHPADRLESLAKEAAVVMVGYEFDEENKQVLGEFHILDTPNGRIVKSLADYGSNLGVSSRGRGEINESNNSVIEDSYIFGGFDVVTLPSIKSARPSYQESSDKVENFSSSLGKEIKDAVTLDELQKIEKVLGYIEVPEKVMQSLNESLDEKKKGFNKFEDNTIIPESNKLQEDLEKAYKTIEDLENKLKTKEVVLEKKEELQETKDVVESGDDVETDLDEDWITNTISGEELYLEMGNIRDELESYRKYQVDLEGLRSSSLEYRRKTQILENEKQGLLDKVKESVNLREGYNTKLSNFKQKYNKLATEYDNLKEDHMSLRGKLKEARLVENDVKKLEDEKVKLEQKVGKLEEDKSLLGEVIEDLENSLKDVKELSEKYVEIRADQAGVSSKVLKESLSNDYTAEDVETAISAMYEEKSRSNNLPFNSANLISLKEQGERTEKFKNAKEMLNNFRQTKK